MEGVNSSRLLLFSRSILRRGPWIHCISSSGEIPPTARLDGRSVNGIRPHRALTQRGGEGTSANATQNKFCSPLMMQCNPLHLASKVVGQSVPLWTPLDGA